MGKLTKFEDLKCWKSARILCKEVFISSTKGALGNDRDTRSQYRRATVSIMNNIAEGFGRFSKKEKIRFLEISVASANEVKSMLYLFEDISYYEKNKLIELHAMVNETRNLTLGFIKYLSNK